MTDSAQTLADTPAEVEDSLESTSPKMPWWWPTADYPGDEVAAVRLRQFVSFAVVFGACWFMFATVRPELIFRNTTATGGDMGAHVWGPAYLRDVLLPNLRLSGWTPDWYAGFPAYTFYMVVPSLLIVLLDVGFIPWFIGLAVVVPLAIFAGFKIRQRLTGRLTRVAALTALTLLTLVSIDFPYNIAFKLVTVLGLITLPAAIWFLGSGLGLRFPGPELLALVSLPFLVDETLFHILGGNLASTMAGEFAFSLSFTACIFFLGLAARGLRTGKYRASAAAVLAFALLCHVIAGLIYGVVALVPLIAVSWRQGRWRSIARWLIPTGVTGGMLASFWYLPFLGFSDFLNDMGWEKYGRIKQTDGSYADVWREYFGWLFPIGPHKQTLSGALDQNDPNMLHGRVIFLLAAVGIVLSLVFLVRAGIYFTLVGLLSAMVFRFMPQHRFWNARILPLYYLSVYLLAAIGLFLLVRALWTLARRTSHVPQWLNVTTVLTASGVVAVMLGLAMQIMPWGKVTADQVVNDEGTTETVNRYHWGPFATTYLTPAKGWATYNFEGYEGRTDVDATTGIAPWTELRDIRDTMRKVGSDHGCGRTFWEYEPHLDRFGTPMALMLLPYWTKSCIGSMEGLYFEASSTTPFHFAIQGELSAQCSCAQRWDSTFGIESSEVYKGVQFDQGIKHLQMLGVRYFMATSQTIKDQAAADSRLTKVASVHSWEVYQVADTELVTGVDHLPARWTKVSDGIHSWAPAAIKWFEDQDSWSVLRSLGGPSNWPTVSAKGTPKSVKITPAKVSKIRATQDSLSFDVDQIGKPVLVKTSYFPNWDVSGAEGPYRVAPNQMVVIPTAKHVELTYGRSWLELGSMFITLLGLGALAMLIRKGDVEVVSLVDWPGDRDDPEPAAVDSSVNPTQGLTDSDGSGARADTDGVSAEDGAPTDTNGDPNDGSGVESDLGSVARPVEDGPATQSSAPSGAVWAVPVSESGATHAVETPDPATEPSEDTDNT